MMYEFSPVSQCQDIRDAIVDLIPEDKLQHATYRINNRVLTNGAALEGKHNTRWHELPIFKGNRYNDTIPRQWTAEVGEPFQPPVEPLHEMDYAEKSVHHYMTGWDPRVPIASFETYGLAAYDHHKTPGDIHKWNLAYTADNQTPAIFLTTIGYGFSAPRAQSVIAARHARYDTAEQTALLANNIRKSFRHTSAEQAAKERSLRLQAGGDFLLKILRNTKQMQDMLRTMPSVATLRPSGHWTIE